jgi:NADH dehydrogenase FAD-containing subunit
MAEARHRVVVIGAGFGGLQAVLRLKGAPVDITLIDRRNHHLVAGAVGDRLAGAAPGGAAA